MASNRHRRSLNPILLETQPLFVSSDLSTLGLPVLPRTVPAESPRKTSGRARRIVAVGGGKGGVGKSLISASLAICLARRGKRVVVVDADLGGANVHTALGLSSPELTMADFIQRRVKSIEDVIVPTGVENLGLISGAHNYLSASNMKYQQKMRLLNQVRTIDADYLLLDLGAGISFNIVDFFLLADTGLLVVVPEPSSIENAYRFLKMSFYRNLRGAAGADARRLIDHAMDQKNLHGIRSPFDILDAVERLDPEAGRRLKERASALRPTLVINQIRYPDDERLGPSMASVCRKHLGVDLDVLGSVAYDDGVWQANRRKRAFVTVNPDSPAADAIDRVAVRLVALHEDGAR